MEEEIFIFPSDIDAEVRKMEYLFSQSLRILSTHLKSRVQGKGMAAVRSLFEIMEHSNAPRLTFYNHDEEQIRLSVLASLRIASESAQIMALQESAYLQSIADEQARIAAEVEQKRQEEIAYKLRAEQEALRTVIARGAHIAATETARILADQEVAERLQMEEFRLFEQEDTVMTDQATEVPEPSVKGKEPIVAVTSPISPKKEERSSSSSIPPAVQKALDSIRTELAAELREDIGDDIRNEIDELRIDLRTDLREDFRADIAASEENTKRRMEEMMATLLKAIQDIKKP
jgi:hypothetical protein